MSDEDEPSVMGGASSPIPMPTEEDFHKAWRAVFIAHAVKLDVLDAESAADLFEAGKDDWDYAQRPEEALEAEIETWNQE